MFYVRSNARICLHFLSFLNICKKPTLISTRHKSFLTCSLDRTKQYCYIWFALAYTFRQFCTTVASHHTAVMQIMDTELWLDGLGWDDRKCCPSHDFWHRLQPRHQWLIHVLHPEQIWLLPQHTVYSVCSYLPGVCRQLILNASGAEAAGQGVQKSRQREEMQRAIRDSGQRHHEL